MVWFAAFSVYPHLSGADHAVDARLGNALELPHEEIINALPRVVRQDFNVPDAILSIRFSIQIQLIDRLGKGCYIAGLRIVALELANTSSVTPVTLDISIGKCHWKTQPGFFGAMVPALQFIRTCLVCARAQAGTGPSGQQQAAFQTKTRC